MSMVGFPLLLIPFAIYNIIALLMPSVSFDVTLAKLTLVSGAEWPITLSDVLLTLGILLLLLEVMKSARPGGKYLTDHLLSFLVLGATAAEFVMWRKFGTSTFFLLVLMAMVDFFAGIALRGRRAAVKPASRTTVVRREPKEVEPKAVEPKAVEPKAVEPKEIEPKEVESAAPHVEPDPTPAAAPAPPPASAAPAHPPIIPAPNTPAPTTPAPAAPAPVAAVPAARAPTAVVPPAASVAESVLMDRPEPIDRPEPKLAQPEPAKPAAPAIEHAAPAPAEDTLPVPESKPEPVVEPEERHEPAAAAPSPEVPPAESHPDGTPPASPETPKH